MSRWDEVGDRIFRRRYASLDLNIGLILGDDECLVVDSRATYAQADELLEHISSVTSAPVRWVVNTHHHWDHTFGNARFPTSDVVGHEACATRLIERGSAMKEQVKGLVPPDQHDAIEAIELVPPATTFSDQLDIVVGGRVVQLRHFGRGHTDNDIIIRVDGVVFAGDLLEESAPPYFGDGFPLDWPDTVKKTLDNVSFVPGHGDVMDRGAAAAQLEDLTAVRAKVLIAIADEEPITEGPYPVSVMETALARGRVTHRATD